MKGGGGVRVARKLKHCVRTFFFVPSWEDHVHTKKGLKSNRFKNQTMCFRSLTGAHLEVQSNFFFVCSFLLFEEADVR